MIGEIDEQLAAAFHGVARIDGQIEKHQLDLGAVDQGGPQAGGEAGLDLDGASQRTFHQIHHADHGPLEIGRAGFQLLPAREGQQLAGQRSAALGGQSGRFEAAADLVLLDHVEHEIDIAQDHHQQIVEIMGDARGQLADRLEALHLAQRALDPLAFLDLPDQLAVDLGQFLGARLDTALERLVQELQRPLGAAAFAPFLGFGQGAVDHRRQARQALFQHIIGGALAQGLDGEFLAHHAGNENERHVEVAGAHHVERAQPVEIRQ